jgi:EmrB/QacA subfamily drug resistance transporter
MAEASGTGLDRGTMLALAAMAAGVFLIANDFTALCVALPTMEKDLDTNVGTVQWVINGYALVFGVLIVTGGRLADMFGRRKLFFIGAGIFATFSAAAAAAPTIGILLAARVAMGVGGAIMWPAVLGMTFAALPEDKQGLAGGLIIGVAGIGNAFGPLLGGFLTEALSWRWVFVINVPVTIVAVAITWRYIHQPPTGADDDKVDYLGVATISASLVALLLALDLAPDHGWGYPAVIILLAASAVSMVAFAFAERRAGANALVPKDVIGNRDFLAACIAVPMFAMGFFTLLMYLPQFFTKLLDDTALEAGLGLLPFMATFALVSFVSGTLYERLGAKIILSAGAAFQVAGLALLALIDESWGYAQTVPGMFLFGIGVGLFISTVTTAAVTALDEKRASLGGAILYMFQVAGGSLGLGISTSIFASAANSQLDSDATAAGLPLKGDEVRDVQGILAGTDTAQEVARQFPGQARDITNLVSDAFIAGLQSALVVTAVVAAVGLVVTVLFVGGRLRFGGAKAGAEETPA